MQNDVLDGVEHESDVIRIRSASDMRIHLLLVWRLVQQDKLSLQKLRRLVVVEASVKFREANIQVDFLHFLSEQIALVQEENQGNILEPSRVANFVEELQ